MPKTEHCNNVAHWHILIKLKKKKYVWLTQACEHSVEGPQRMSSVYVP